MKNRMSFFLEEKSLDPLSDAAYDFRFSFLLCFGSMRQKKREKEERGLEDIDTERANRGDKKVLRSCPFLDFWKKKNSSSHFHFHEN